jgi:hypothetical protein
VPAHLEANFINPVSVYLNGMGTVNHILNDKGEATMRADGDDAVPKWWCPDGPLPPTPSPSPVPPSPPSPSPVPPSPSPTPVPPSPSPSPVPPSPPSPSPSPSPVPPTPTPSPTPTPTPPPTPSPPAPPSCNVGDLVECPGSPGATCAGNQCCPDMSICPSADQSFSGCPMEKVEDCTQPSPSPAPGPAPSPTPSPTPGPSPSPAQCAPGDLVQCPGGSAAQCAGDQCCPDGSACPSAHATFSGCPMPKAEDCTGGGFIVV